MCFRKTPVESRDIQPRLGVAHYLSERGTSLVLKTIDNLTMPLALKNNRGSVYRGRMKIEVPER